MSASRPFLHGALATLLSSLPRLVPVLCVLFLTAVPSNTARAETAYGIQIAAYQDLDHAVERVNYLKRLGYSAFYHYETVHKKGKWYRVYIARFPTRSQAEEEARVLQDLKLIEDYEIRILRNGASAPAKPPPAKPAPAAGRKTPPARQPAKSAKRGNMVYLLHVSSYRDKENAVEETQHLKSAGQKAFFVEEDLASGTWFRIYLGKWETEKQARAAGSRLKKQGIITYFKPLEIDRDALSGGQ